MKIFFAHSLVVCGLLFHVTHGFVPRHAVSPLVSSSSVPLSSRLDLSLNDEWSELTNRLTGAGSMNSQASLVGPAVTKSAPVSSQTVQLQIFQFPDLSNIFKSEDISMALEKLGFAGAEATSIFVGLPLVGKITVVLLPLAAMILGAFYNMALIVPDDFRKGFEPYQRGKYDPIAAKAFYSRHKLLVLQRASQVLRLSNGFLYNILFDKYILRDEDRNRAKRAEELLDLVTKLGPTAIKIGQALSVRPDLIPQEYAKALSTLQDSVPPFDGKEAKEILRRELGPEKYSHLKNFPFMTRNSGPVASASIGQVYRGFIDNQEVAVKVQRPNVLAEIALDLHLVREFAPLYKKLTRTASDLQGLADEWGRGFIAELDYRKEAESTIRFTEEMKKRNLDAVSAPNVITKYSTEQILTTEWVEDGTLVILDFGMTLDIDPSLQYSLLEYVAHLTSNDYDKIPEDMVALGFLKEEKLEFVKRSGVLEPLKYFLRQASEGGGAKGVRERIFSEYRAKYPGLSDDELRIEMRSEMKAQVSEMAKREGAVTGITVEVEELQRRNRDSFRIPEWFLYTSRAFLTLEGVSLQADPNFSIIKSCFPYVAKRLLADDNPRAQNALRELLYGAENQIDSKRVLDLADGFSTYTTTSKKMNKKSDQRDYGLVLANGGQDDPVRSLTPAERREKVAQTQATLTLAKDSADILLNREGNLVQKLLLEESVRATSAQVKDNIRNALVDGPQRFRDSLPLGVGSFLPPLPFEDGLRPFVLKSDDEKKAQQLADKLFSLVSQQQLDRIRRGVSVNEDAGTSSPPPGLAALLEGTEPEQLALLARELRESAPKYIPLAGILGAKFASALLQTASDNIDAALTKLDMEGQQTDVVTLAAARGVSNAAKRSASLISESIASRGSSSDVTTGA